MSENYELKEGSRVTEFTSNLTKDIGESYMKKEPGLYIVEVTCVNGSWEIAIQQET